MRDIVDHRYRIEHRLAAGGFGAIYRATDLQVGRPVALKVLHRELAGDASVVARFRREAAALAKLKSPHTLTLYDIGEADDTLYLVMELLRGQSLQEVFDRGGPLPWRRVARIARGVCSSLREAHEAGIIHRDLKPANIFLEEHAFDIDFVKVLDFGIAKVLDGSDLDPKDLTRHGQMIGTFDYMAPEQMLGGATTAKSDVFTLGVVMYEMIRGRRPFGEPAGPAGMLAALLTTTPEPLRAVPPALARMIARCLEREAAGRPTTEELDALLVHVLELAPDVDAVGTTPPPLPADPDAPTVAVVADDVDAPTVLDNTVPADLDEPWDAATRPRGFRRNTLPRGSAQPLLVAGSLAQVSPPPPVSVLPVLPAVRARGSEAALAGPMAEGTDADGASLAVRFQRSQLPEPPRARLASGTSPITNERAMTRPVAPDSGVLVAVRWLAIVVALFGLGFLAVLTIASL